MKKIKNWCAILPVCGLLFLSCKNSGTGPSVTEDELLGLWIWETVTVNLSNRISGSYTEQGVTIVIDTSIVEDNTGTPPIGTSSEFLAGGILIDSQDPLFFDTLTAGTLPKIFRQPIEVDSLQWWIQGGRLFIEETDDFGYVDTTAVTANINGNSGSFIISEREVWTEGGLTFNINSTITIRATK